MSEDFDFISAQNDDVSVSAYPSDGENGGRVWTYCMRVENNSGEPITLVKKELCATDENGRTNVSSEIGFNGELPDLNVGEYFEFEDNVQICGNSLAVYGYCTAVTAKGKELKIKLPVISLSSPEQNTALSVC